MRPILPVNGGVRQVNVIMNLGVADYNGLQTQFSYRGNRRMYASVSYTLGKASSPPRSAAAPDMIRSRSMPTGGRAERRNIDVVGTICEVMDGLARCPTRSSHRELITFVSDRPGHDFRYAIDFGKLNNELGWSPEHSFEQGLESTVRWYMDNRAWWEPLMSTHQAAARRGLSSMRI